jgi:hypothetical protein
LAICNRHFIADYPELVETIIWSLSNLVDLNEFNRNMVIESDIFQSIMERARIQSNSLIIKIHIETTFRLFRNIINPEFHILPSLLIHEIITLAAKIINPLLDIKALVAILTTLMNISEYDNDEFIYAIINTEIIDEIFKIEPNDLGLQNAVLVLFGNILCLNIADKLLEMGLLEYFNKIHKRTSNSGIKKLVYWNMSNITGSCSPHIVTLLKSDLFVSILDGLADPCFTVRKAIILIIKNATDLRDLEITALLVYNKTVEKLLNKLANKNDKEIIGYILHIFINILLTSSCIEEHKDYRIKNEIDNLNAAAIFEELTLHENKEVSNLAEVIINKFYTHQPDII